MRCYGDWLPPSSWSRVGKQTARTLPTPLSQRPTQPQAYTIARTKLEPLWHPIPTRHPAQELDERPLSFEDGWPLYQSRRGIFKENYAKRGSAEEYPPQNREARNEEAATEYPQHQSAHCPVSIPGQAEQASPSQQLTAKQHSLPNHPANPLSPTESATCNDPHRQKLDTLSIMES